MTRIISVSNLKGGVGKTTTTINLAASLAIAELRVLIIDVDPTGALSTGLGLETTTRGQGLFEIYSGVAGILDARQTLNFLNIDIIPSNVGNSERENRLIEMAKNRIRLKRQLSGLLTLDKLNYDYILLDTPPSLNDLTISALLAAHSILIPLQCGYFALRAVERMIKVVNRIKSSANPELAIEGILLNFHEKGTRASIRGVQEAKKAFGNLLFKTIIPKNAAIGFASFEKKPVSLIDIAAPGARAYLALAEEIMQKNKPQFAEKNETYFIPSIAAH